MLMNPALSGLRCIRCATLFPGRLSRRLPVLSEAGHPASLECVYTPSTSSVMSLPVLHPITLAKATRPAWSRPLAQGSAGRLWLKCESANPTGTDRMAAQLGARLAGATRVAARPAATQVFLAAYCAAAGLQAEIAITRTPDAAARGHATFRRPSHRVRRQPGPLAARGPAMPRTRRLRRHQLPNPPTGTHAYGVEGYKPIAREIFDHCGLPTDVIVPTARGDLLWGVLLGWQALHRQGLIPRLPRMHAVEPYARLSRALQTGDARLWEAGTNTPSPAAPPRCNRCRRWLAQADCPWRCPMPPRPRRSSGWNGWGWPRSCPRRRRWRPSRGCDARACSTPSRRSC